MSFHGSLVVSSRLSRACLSIEKFQFFQSRQVRSFQSESIQLFIASMSSLNHSSGEKLSERHNKVDLVSLIAAVGAFL